MPGHMGCENRTTYNMQVFKVDISRSLVYLRGTVPGFAGNFVTLRDSFYNPQWKAGNSEPPFPSWLGKQRSINALFLITSISLLNFPQC